MTKKEPENVMDKEPSKMQKFKGKGKIVKTSNDLGWSDTKAEMCSLDLGAFNESIFSDLLTQLVSYRPEL